MKLDINMLKEDKASYDKWKALEKEFELNGEFNKDTDPVDWNACDPVTEDYEYIKKGVKNAILHKIYLAVLKIYTKKINKKLLNLKIVGKENLKHFKGGAIVTCNHISKADSFPIREALGMDIMYVAADFNNWKGEMGVIGRNTGYLPLPTTLNKKIMRKFNESIEYYLSKGKKILMYPEQSMWRDYIKPRPLKNGAFHYAVKHNVPILPLFITIKPKKEEVDELNRANFGDYTLHILSPIYPKENLSEKDNVDYMRQENYRLWKDLYEKTYNIPLTYTTVDKSKIKI